MKLVNCKLLQIEEFYGTSIPKSYAILSHRWELEEVTYQDLQTPGLGMTKAGWAKINDFCRIALDNGYEYGWVDTCCIDKRNLTELTEAINSMFKWYANSSVCYAYLSDILSGQPLESSLWFTRGWTLQELIAPSRMMFFDKKWEFIGTRDSLGDAIQLRSRVDKEMLEDTALPRNISNMLSIIPVARRMSWASERTTTREEDRAYSLLGIFGVNMPMLYGEGSRAFMRLQEEIAKETNDLSLFAWTRQENSCANPANPSEGTTGAELPEEEGSKPCGILATSPDEFRLSSDLVLKRDIMYNPEFTITNKELKITIQATTSKDNIWRISLGCRRSDDSPEDTIGILLKELGGGEFVRWDAHHHIQWQGDHQGQETTFYIKRFADGVRFNPVRNCTFQLHANSKMRFDNATPKGNWSSQMNKFITEGLDVFEGVVFCHHHGIYDSWQISPWVVVCGFDPRSKQTWACVGSAKGPNQDLFEAAKSGDMHQAGNIGRARSKMYDSTLASIGKMGSYGKARMRTARRSDGGEGLDIFLEITGIFGVRFP